MRHATYRPAVFLILAGTLATPSRGLVVPGADGSDGALTVNATTTIDLSLAPTGTWNGPNAMPGKGVYDPEKWAVVFRYSSVTINVGALSFANHPSKAPVVWLVNGNVTISGVGLNLSGQRESGTIGGEGGPGGGQGNSSQPDGAGFGPGGGQTGPNNPGVFSQTATGNPFKPYGSPGLVPLIGGSGGHRLNNAAGGGGGAILIAATGTITVNSEIDANGVFFGGSGGGIRLVAPGILGSGSLLAIGSDGGSPGRIRVESTQFSGSMQCNPIASTASLPATAIIWPPAEAPSVRVASLNATPIPVTSGSHWPPATPDVTLPGAALYEVIVETKNVPVTRKVRVKLTPRAGSAVLADATLVSGNDTLATWRAEIQFVQGFSTVQARVDEQ